MPSKGNRAASRQAKLRQKKRRIKSASQIFDSGPSDSQMGDEETATGKAIGPRREIVGTVSSGSSRSSRRVEATMPTPRYEYLGAELRRIGILAVVIFAILAILSVAVFN